MTPDELSQRHPRLFHVTDSAALPGILQHGLMPTSDLLDLVEVTPEQRARIERRRAEGETLTHAQHGRAVITDNVPLSERALAGCLDDGLTPADWMAILNRRVFFWTDTASVATLLGARLNRARERLVLVLDTLGIAQQCAGLIELAAINSGSTIRRPARRGLGTFTPLERYSYPEWQRLRGRRDRIREVTVTGRVDIRAHLLDRHISTGPRRTG